MAAVADMTEAHLGQMAEGKAARSGIKDFGQTLVKDHTKAYQELTALDNKLGQRFRRVLTLAATRRWNGWRI